MFIANAQCVQTMVNQCLFQTKFSFSPIPISNPQAPICACGSTTVVLSPSALVLRAVELGVPALSLGPGAAFLSTYAREQV